MKHTYFLHRIVTAAAVVILSASVFSCTEKEPAPVDPNPNDTTVTPDDPLPHLPVFGGEVTYFNDTAHVTYIIIEGPQKINGLDSMCEMLVYFDNDDFASILYPVFDGDSVSYSMVVSINQLDNPNTCIVNYCPNNDDEVYSLSRGTLTFVRVDDDTYHLTFWGNSYKFVTYSGDITSQYFDYKHPIGIGNFQYRDQQFPLHYGSGVSYDQSHISYFHFYDLLHSKRFDIIVKDVVFDGVYQIVENQFSANSEQAVVWFYEDGDSGTVEYQLNEGTITVSHQGLVYTVEISGTTDQGPIALTYSGCFFNWRTYQFYE